MNSKEIIINYIIFYKKQNLFYRFEKYTKDLIKKNINILNK